MMMAIRFGKVKSYKDWCTPKIVGNALELLDKEIPKHKKKIKGHYKISLSFSDSYNCALPFSLVPGKKLCARCLNEVKNI